MYQVYSCNECIHYPICAIKKEYADIEQKILQMDAEVIKDNDNFALVLECYHFNLKEEYKTII